VMRPCRGRSRSRMRKIQDEIIRAKMTFTITRDAPDSFRLIPTIKLHNAQSTNSTQSIESGTVAYRSAARVVTTSIMLLSAGSIWFDEMKFAGFLPSRAARCQSRVEILLDRFI